MKIFLVIGSSGSYSDHAEWPVKAFLSNERAQAFAESLPKIWTDLRAIRPEDKEEAQKLWEQRVAAYKIEQEARGIRLSDSKPLPDWLQSPSPLSSAINRACNQMREHDPHFNGDDTSWDVVEVELED